MEHRIFHNKDKTLDKLSVIIYNIEGVRRLFTFDNADIDNLCKNHIIGLYETWSEELVSIKYFSRYSSIQSKAKRNFHIGRSSGGLVLYYRNDIFKLHSTIKIHDNFITARLYHKALRMHITIMLCYIPPKAEYNPVVTELQDLLMHIQATFDDDIILVCGDFNGRIADMTEATSSYIINWGAVQSDRLSHDTKKNIRGEMLMESMNEQNMIVLNGRAVGDVPANFTFSNTQGQSVIDLFFINDKHVDKCKRLDVLAIPHSMHFPVQITLSCEVNSNVITTTKIKWDENKASTYTEILASLLPYDKRVDYNIFCEAIYQAADSCGMIKKCTFKTKIVKDWYDAECRAKRNEAKAILKCARKGVCGMWEKYAQAKKSYVNLIRKKKSQHEKFIAGKLNNCKNATDFWKVVKNIEEVVLSKMR